LAIVEGDLSKVKQLVEVKDQDVIEADRNKFKFTPLSLVYLLNEKEIFHYLLEKDWPVNALDENAYSVLHYMILKDDRDSVVDLIQNTKANVNLQRNTMNRVHSALEITMDSCGKEMLWELLKSPTFQVNALNDQHEIFLFSLMKSNRFNHVDKIYLILYLLIQRCDVNAMDQDGKQALAYPISWNCPPLLGCFICYGADVNAVDDKKNTPLYYAIKMESEEMVSLLLEHGADATFVDIFGWSLLAYAIKQRCSPVAQLLIKHGADVNFVVNFYDERTNQKEISMFFLAIKNNLIDVVRMLVEYGVVFDFKNEDSLKQLMFLLSHDYCNGILYYLLECGKLDPRDLTMPCLTDLIWMDRHDQLEFLVKYGFDVNLKDEGGETLLVKAIYNIKKSLTNQLLKYKVDLTPLNENIVGLRYWFRSLKDEHKSASYLIRELIKRGLDVNAQDCFDNTLLIYSIENQDLESIAVLLEAGADPFYRNLHETTILMENGDVLTGGPEAAWSLDLYNDIINGIRHVSGYREIQNMLDHSRARHEADDEAVGSDRNEN